MMKKRYGNQFGNSFLEKTDSETVASGSEGIDSITSNGKYDFVLLDLNLKGQKENGIEILQRVKHTQFDLPVIMNDRM